MILILIFLLAGPLPSEADYKKALEKLAVVQDDPDANAVAGKYLAFVLGDYKAGMDCLAKSPDKVLRTLAEHERAPLYTDSPMKQVSMGDEWVLALKHFPSTGRVFQDRACYWYGLAWPDMKSEPLWGDKLREKLRKLSFVNQAASPMKAFVPVKSWTGDAIAKVGTTQAAAHGGTTSVQVTAFKAGRAYCPIIQAVGVKQGVTYKLSCWVLCDGTDQPESLRVHVQDSKGSFILIKGAPILADQPWWHKVEFEFEAGKDAVLASVDIAISSSVGSIYVDDFSVQAPGGANLVKNPGFEEK